MTTQDVVWRLLLAAAVIIVLARGVGALFRRVNQPQVVGEIVAGILLGPSVLGALVPSASRVLFSARVLPHIDVLSQVGLIFFMFLVGLELDVRLLRGRGRAALTVSWTSIVLPFSLGVVAALAAFPVLGSGRFLPFALFVGASMSITAFPVLARILTERGLARTRLGTVTLACAAIDDVSAWCLLAVVVAVARSHGSFAVVRTMVLAVGFAAVMVTIVRPIVARFAAHHEQEGELTGGMLALVFAGVLLSALATDRIGIHAIFGAFLFGAVMPQRSELIRELAVKLEDFTVVFFLPLFFAFTGLRTQLGQIGTDPTRWGLFALVLGVAIAGKWGGATAAARSVGLAWRESMAVGILMNTRGLTELIILNIGLDLHVIPPSLFAMLVIVALVTTFMTTPLLAVAYPRDLQERMAREAGEDDEEERRPFTIVVQIARQDEAAELVHTAMRLSPDDGRIVLLRVVRLPDSSYRAGPLAQERMIERASESLRPFAGLVEGAGLDVVPVVVPTAAVADTIARVAGDERADLVLLAWHRSPFGRRLLGGIVGDVLREVKADVAVLVDPARRGVALQRGGRILVPHGGGYHEDVGLDLALRLGAATGAAVTLLGPPEDDAAHDLAQRAAAAYEQTGVTTTPLPVTGDVTDALVERARDADLIVLGVSDRWGRDQHSLGALREAIAARAPVPVLVVRRHGQPGQRRPARWLRRHREWMDDTGEHELVGAQAPS
jgi:Kef-type K+ transport system membrane component KefB/nucleotide-binding universal stress UspA family protein